MGKFKKIFNYYLSSYWNNSRTLSSMYSFLKIFFERNNKIDSTVSSFGNVFRNSKWSNMQTQNIKKLFIRQWLWFFCVLTLLITFLFTYSQVTLSFSYLTIFFIKQTLNEVITNVYYFIGCIIYQLYIYVNSLFINNQQITIQNHTLHSTVSNHVVSKVTPSNTPMSVNRNLFFLQKTLPLFNDVSSSKTDFVSMLSSSHTNRNLLLSTDFLNQVHFLPTLSQTQSSFTSQVALPIESPYVLTTSLNPAFSSSITFSTTLGNLYNQSSSIQNDPALTETITHSLNNTAKQQRWLTKNFWSNQNFVNDSNKITEAKNFIQNPLLSHSSIDTNIWLSNKLSGLETEKTSAAFRKLAPNYELLSVFNSFDTSRFFLNQRYTILNQLPNQFITNSISTLPVLNSTGESSTVNLKLTILRSYFVRNLPFNVELYNSNSQTSLNVSSLAVSDSLNTGSNTSNNFFLSTTFTDLLQQSDLQALNTLNASTNTISKLHLNKNFTSTNFKS